MAWNQTNPELVKQRIAQERRKKITKHALFGVVATVCIGLIVFFYLMDPFGADSQSHKPAKPNKEAQSFDKKVNAPEEPNADVSIAQVPKTDKVSEQEPEKRPMTPEEIEAEERKKDPLYDRHHIVAKMPLVKEPIEQLMLSVFTVELGDMPPMLPTIPPFDEEKFEKLVNRKTKAEKGDSEEALLSKEIVNEVKKELAEYIKEGGTVNGFLSYYVNELDMAFKERQQSSSEMLKVIKTEDPEVAREYYRHVNRRLAEKGIKPLTLNKRQREHLGIEE